jgi:micrococcal nuclease
MIPFIRNFTGVVTSLSLLSLSSLFFAPTAFAKKDLGEQKTVAEANAGNLGPKFVVVSCNDGDTCKLKNSDNITLKVRLVGIDAPEFAKSKTGEGQPHAQQSKEYLNDLVQGKEVSLKVIGTDMFGRSLGEIYVGENNVNLKLVEAGMVEVYRGRPPAGVDIEKYQLAEQSAKSNKKGIWTQSNYESPQAYRKKLRK